MTHRQDWNHETGVTTSSFMHQVKPTGDGPVSVFDLPRILRDELGMRILDFNTNTFACLDDAGVHRLRDEVDRAGCIVTNLKLNQRDVDMNHADPAQRDRALAVYRRSVEHAAILGARWVRPLPCDDRPDMAIHVDGYRRLADHAAERGLSVVVENYGWMAGDPESVPRLIAAVDRGLAASPDTGSWQDNEVRYAGLARCFPLAVTCDYKAFVLGSEGEHADYDLRRCWTLGRDAGFTGPWCFEHWNEDTQALYRELRLLRDLIAAWAA